MKSIAIKTYLAIIALLTTSCGSENDSPAHPSNIDANASVSSNISPNNIPKLSAVTSTSVPTIDIDIQSDTSEKTVAWLLSETPDTPLPTDTRWVTSRPQHYTLFSTGRTTIYGWVKGEKGSVYGPGPKTVTYTLPTTYDEYSPDLFIQNPQRAIGFIKVNADFWRKMKDESKGGFFTYPPHSSTTNKKSVKSFLTQSRIAYVFARAFMVTGNKSYLDDARDALDFLYRYGWDKENGGWYFIADENGEPLTDQGWESEYNTKYKWTFQQHYALLGPTAMFEATRSSTDMDWLQKGYAVSSKKLWDDREEKYGYFDKTDHNWLNPTGKSFTATVDAITTHALILYLLTHKPDYLMRLRQLGDNILNYMVASIDSPDVLIGMVEQFDTNWKRDTTSWEWSKGYVGHVLKASWCLARIYLITKDAKYKEGAMRLIKRVLDDGSYDFTFGGPYTKFDWVTGTITDDHKNFWNLEQAVLSGLINTHTSSNEEQKARSLSMAKDSLNFFFKYLPDRQNGGIYEHTSADGNIIDNPEKAGIFKAGYHTVELGYYTYLYTTLFFSDKPAPLYYYIAPETQDRDIRLTPIAIEDSRLYIKGVKLDGNPYPKFNPQTRTLHIPAGTGGKFQVTFQANKK